MEAVSGFVQKRQEVNKSRTAERMMKSEKLSFVATATDAVAFFCAALPREQKEEHVFVLPLDANGKVLAKPILVSVGSEDGTTVIDAGAIFRAALKADAEEIIIAHNHPSGDVKPSKADIATTKELTELAGRLHVKFLDHLILAGDKVLSFKERHLI